MDKMGSSNKAGTKGVPATPRDGAPVELTSLLKKGLDFMVALNKNHPKIFPYSGIDDFSFK